MKLTIELERIKAFKMDHGGSVARYQPITLRFCDYEQLVLEVVYQVGRALRLATGEASEEERLLTIENQPFRTEDDNPEER